MSAGWTMAYRRFVGGELGRFQGRHSNGGAAAFGLRNDSKVNRYLRPSGGCATAISRTLWVDAHTAATGNATTSVALVPPRRVINPMPWGRGTVGELKDSKPRRGSVHTFSSARPKIRQSAPGSPSFPEGQRSDDRVPTEPFDSSNLWTRLAKGVRATRLEDMVGLVPSISQPLRLLDQKRREGDAEFDAHAAQIDKFLARLAQTAVGNCRLAGSRSLGGSRSHPDHLAAALGVFSLVGPTPQRRAWAKTILDKILSSDAAPSLDGVVAILRAVARQNVPEVRTAAFVSQMMDLRAAEVRNLNAASLAVFLPLVQRFATAETTRMMKAAVDRALLAEQDASTCLGTLRTLVRQQRDGNLSLETIRAIRCQLLDQLPSLAHSVRLDLYRTFTKLRQFQFRDVRLVLSGGQNGDAAEGLKFVSPGVAIQGLIGLTMINYGNLNFIEALLESKAVQSLNALEPLQCLDVAYTVCYYNLQEQCKCLNLALSKVVLLPTASFDWPRLVRLGEIAASLEVDFRAVQTRIPEALISAAMQAERRLIRLPVVRETIDDLEQFLKLHCAADGTFERDQIVGAYTAQLVDRQRKIIVEIESIHFPTSRTLRHRHFERAGYKTVVVPAWRWNQARPAGRQAIWHCCLNAGPPIFAYAEQLPGPKA